MTDLDIIREVQTARFYQLLEQGAEPGIEVTEVHGDEAFEEYVKGMEEEIEQKRMLRDLEPIE